MRQQFPNPAGLVRRQSGQHILEIRVRIMSIKSSRLDQAHHRSPPLARAKASGEHPVISPNGNRPDLILDPVVVHGELPVGRE